MPITLEITKAQHFILYNLQYTTPNKHAECLIGTVKRNATQQPPRDADVRFGNRLQCTRASRTVQVGQKQWLATTRCF